MVGGLCREGVELVVLRQVYILPVVALGIGVERIVLDAERTEAHGVVMSEGVERIHGVLVFESYLGHEERVVS